MKTLIKIVKSFENADLPIIQKNIVSASKDGIDAILSVNRLNIALGPCFSYHYFFVSGTTDSDTVTTKSTDGSCEAWGTQSKQAERNAFELSYILKAIIRSVATNVNGGSLTTGLNEKVFYNGKRVPGVTCKNTSKLNS